MLLIIGILLMLLGLALTKDLGSLPIFLFLVGLAIVLGSIGGCIYQAGQCDANYRLCSGYIQR